MHGNMQLIVELYKVGQIKSSIVQTCIDEMLTEINTRNVEILCQMIEKLGGHAVERSRKDREDGHKKKND